MRSLVAVGGRNAKLARDVDGNQHAGVEIAEIEAIDRCS